MGGRTRRQPGPGLRAGGGGWTQAQSRTERLLCRVPGQAVPRRSSSATLRLGLGGPRGVGPAGPASRELSAFAPSVLQRGDRTQVSISDPVAAAQSVGRLAGEATEAL